jgi:hypothetical protein
MTPQQIKDLEAEGEAVKNGSLEPDPIKIAKAEEELESLKSIPLPRNINAVPDLGDGVLR